jgi:hypothetical protein
MKPISTADVGVRGALLEGSATRTTTDPKSDEDLD